MNRAIALFGVLLVFGCSAPAPDSSNPEAPCWLTLAPDGEHDNVIQETSDRLYAATGAGFTVHGCGIPVIFESKVFAFGDEVCGVTFSLPGGTPISIHIATEPSGVCLPLVEVLMHESMHPVVGLHIHAHHGLFAAKSEPGAVLEGESLDMLCDALGGCPQRQDERVNLGHGRGAPTALSVGPLWAPIQTNATP